MKALIRIVVTCTALLAVHPASYAQAARSVSLSEAYLPPEALEKTSERIPLRFTVPANYVKRYVAHNQSVVWGTEEDVAALLKEGNSAKTRSGVFTLKISPNVGYDSRKNKFTNEDEFVAKANKSGLTNPQFQRSETRGYPMATLTAFVKGRPIYMQYVAVGNGALLISYFPAAEPGARDRDTWERFLKDLKGP